MNKKTEDANMMKVESHEILPPSTNDALGTMLSEHGSGVTRKVSSISSHSLRSLHNPTANRVQGNNKFIMKRPAVQFLSQDKITMPKSLVAKTTQGFNLLPAPTLTLNSSVHKVQTSSNIPNNITLSPVKGGFKIPISPLKNLKNPLRLSLIPTPTTNTSKPVAVNAVASVNNRITSQNTTNFQFQAVVPPQHNRITVNNAQPMPQTLNIQQQLPAGRFQCVRLVPAGGGQPNTPATGIPIANLIPSQSSASAVRTAIVQQQPIQQFLNVQPPLQKTFGPPPAKAQRLIMPATPTQQSPQPTVTNLSPGSVLHAGNVGYAMVPAKYVEQLKKQLNNQVQFKTEPQAQGVSEPSAAAPVAKSVVNGKVRKPCNCTKSMCLKLYCECFANGHFCDGCNCINCHNNVEFDADRSKAIKSCLERNPQAFKPKIGRGGDDSRSHQKGCNCKRSGCLKNYCECYEARIPCTSRCKCIGCKNIEEDGNSEQRSLMNLADAAAVRCQQQAAARSRINSQMRDMRTRSRLRGHSATGERLPCMFFTQEVIEATCTCMLAQAEEAEKTNCSIQVAETMILEEFGRCLMQIIQAASKTKPPASSST